MDQLMTDNNKLTDDLEKFHKLSELLSKYRLYFKQYLEICKCKPTLIRSNIISKTDDLEEEFRRLHNDQDNQDLDEVTVNPEESIGSPFNTNEDNDSQSVNEEEDTSNGAEDHQIVPNKTFICKQKACNQRFDSVDQLYNHRQRCVHKTRQYKCYECGTSFDAEYPFKCHQSMHKRLASEQLNGIKNYVCDENGCNKVFNKKNSLSVHKSRMHRTTDELTDRQPHLCTWIGCGHKTSNSQDLLLHIRRRHTLEKPFKCEECDKSFELEKILRSHQKIHSNVRHVCEYEDCLYKTPHIWELKAHINKKHLNEIRFHCEFTDCRRTYKYESDLKTHIRQSHSTSKRYVCDWPGCQSEFARSESFKNHVLRHKNERQFKCDEDGCGKAFNTNKELYTHRTLHSGTMYRFACEWPGCTKMLAGRYHIKQHIDSVHLRLKSHECDVCQKAFRLKDSLRAHKNKFHSDSGPQNNKKEFTCGQCMRVFTSLNLRANHMNAAHSQEEPFLCDWPECGQRFKTSNSLTAHKLVHMSGEYKCCAIDCGKSFISRHTLLSHELIHDKKFVCHWPGCAKRYATNYLLANHLKRHQNIREFKCAVEGCGQSFVTKNQLNHHLNRHSNPLPYKCTELDCQKGFARKSYLQNHIEKVHHANDNAQVDVTDQ